MQKVKPENNSFIGKFEVYRVKVRALFTGCDSTEGEIYDAVEYDTVYELKCDTG